jgi:hypothetical protein
VHQLASHERGVADLRALPTGELLSVGRDGRVLVWDLAKAALNPGYVSRVRDSVLAHTRAEADWWRGFAADALEAEAEAVVAPAGDAGWACSSATVSDKTSRMQALRTRVAAEPAPAPEMATAGLEPAAQMGACARHPLTLGREPGPPASLCPTLAGQRQTAVVDSGVKAYPQALRVPAKAPLARALVGALREAQPGAEDVVGRLEARLEARLQQRQAAPGFSTAALDQHAAEPLYLNSAPALAAAAHMRRLEDFKRRYEAGMSRAMACMLPEDHPDYARMHARAVSVTEPLETVQEFNLLAEHVNAVNLPIAVERGAKDYDDEDSLCFDHDVLEAMSIATVLPSGAFVTGAKEVVARVGVNSHRGGLQCWDGHVRLSQDMLDDMMSAGARQQGQK